MYEPHMEIHQRRRSKHFDDPPSGGSSLLAELDKLEVIKSFDAFPKVQPTYTTRSRKGGVLTAIVGIIIFLLILNDLGEYLYGEPTFSFKVDPSLANDLQLNVDMTVAMPCHFLSIDLRDVVGDRLHLSDSFVKDGTTFEIGSATSMHNPSPTIPSASRIIADARRAPRPVDSLVSTNSKKSGLKSLFSNSNKKRKHAAYRETRNKIPNGPACRIYGSVAVKKVTANLHVTTLGHGYMSWEHTDHGLMNLSHIIHEFSFGPYFPSIAQPLDQSYMATDAAFPVFQYFLSVVPTTYVDTRRRAVRTSQYAVTDYSRVVEHGRGVPGIFFKFDLEPLTMTVRERTTTLYQFLIRLVGVIGGVWTTASFALRVLSRAEREVKEKLKSDKDLIPSSLPSPGLKKNRAYSQSSSPGYGYQTPQMGGGTPVGGPNSMTRMGSGYFPAPVLIPGQSPGPALNGNGAYEGKSR